jgi:HSP20 family protein
MANLIRRNLGERGREMPMQPQRTEWDPFRMMREMLRFDPFGELSVGWQQPAAFMPAFEVRETENAYLFKADLPGVKDEDLDISLNGNRLTVSGRREAEERQENETYYAYERSYGAFTRSFTLPDGVDGDHVMAELRDGVLTLTVPKKPEIQPKKIQLKPGQSGKPQTKA